MRLHRHDLRDFRLAFGLAFNLRRMAFSSLALGWTLLVVLLVLGIVAWRSERSPLAPTAWLTSMADLADAGITPLRVLLYACIALAWWIGFACLTGPVVRSSAMDVARDERERAALIPDLNRHAALAPVIGLAGPLLALLLAIGWALLALIPGIAGAVVAGVLLPPVLLVTLAGAAMLMVVVASAPMMTPTAMIEGRDALEALSRPMSYVMQQPGRYALHLLLKLVTVLVSAALGACAMVIAWAMVAAALWFTGSADLMPAALRVASGGEAGDAAALTEAMAGVMWASAGLLVAWLMTVSLCTDTVLYLLMRYHVDGVPFDAILVAEDKLEQLDSAVQTAEKAEMARQRGDEAKQPATAAAGDDPVP